MRPIFAGNLDYDTRQSELERLFSKYGRIDHVDMKSVSLVVRSMVKSGREPVSGTVVRRTSGGGSGGVSAGSTMERAMASMQGMGEFGFGKQRKGSGSSITMKVSTSSIPNSVTREDPTTKYELLNELVSLCG